jgi:hypothetical protein
MRPGQNTITIDNHGSTIFGMFSVWLCSGKIDFSERYADYELGWLTNKPYRNTPEKNKIQQLIWCYRLGNFLRSTRFCNYVMKQITIISEATVDKNDQNLCCDVAIILEVLRDVKPFHVGIRYYIYDMMLSPSGREWLGDNVGYWLKKKDDDETDSLNRFLSGCLPRALSLDSENISLGSTHSSFHGNEGGLTTTSLLKV